ncbi:MAG TPA: gamma carbonic anhydrase family protein [Alphaproteobacteria bacterium]
MSLIHKALIGPYRGIDPQIDPSAYITETAVIRGDVVIGAHTSIWHHVLIRGDVNTIRIGSGTNIQDGTVVHVSRTPTGQTVIGDNITIGHQALIHACELQNDCFIGMKACVMDGAVVESFAMVAAGSLVTPNKIVRSGELWMGSPARFVRKLTEDDLKHMRENAIEYRMVANNYTGKS